jgi:hypothetical protein
MFLWNFLTVTLVSVFSYASCTERSAPTSRGEKQEEMNGDTLYHFDHNNTVVEQRFDASLAPASFTHVQVEVKGVQNPGMHPVSFDVFFRPDGQDKFMLGTFSLYPANNPGKFIVPTQGKIKGDGVLILSLRLVDGITDSVTVTTGRMWFVK